MAEQRLFLSMVSDEFEKPAARYPGFRSALAAYLRRAGCQVEVQEDFRQEGAGDTVEKLAGYIRTCAAVVHLVGELPGALADTADVTAFLKAEPNFLKDYPDLRTQLGDCSDLTYTQWEAFLALHYGVSLFVYATDTAAGTQQQHLDRLKSVGRYAELIRSDVDLLGKLIGDLRTIIPSIPELKQEIARSRFLNHTAEDFLGREAEFEFLSGVWQRRINVLSLIAWGGVGKTSLVCEWIQRRFIDQQWKDDDGSPALWRYFDWSFYDQGTGSLDDENATRTGNVGDFFEQALAFFVDPDPTRPGKGQRLARLIRLQHSLLILDGLEPLQQPPNHPQAGRLLDPDLADLLIALAQYNPGLCLITSRQSVADIDGLHGRAAERRDLDELPKEVAVRLLRKLQIKGTDDELAAACELFDCHALSLTLLGRFLFDAHGGDIARIDRVNLHKADRLTRPERHRTAWRVLEAYDGWLNTAQGDPNALRLVGLFDRPATADCLTALRSPPVIPGLTESISTQAMDDDEWNILLRRLERAHLVKLRPSEKQPGSPDIDAHPLVREYFAEQLSSMGTPARASSPSADPVHASATGKSAHPTNPSWIESHSRLFDHLCATTEHRPDTLPGLQPLYQAVTHGCLAGRQHEAYAIFRDRIQRGTGKSGFYATGFLGAVGADLAALSNFFTMRWNAPPCGLSEKQKAWVLREAALRLRSMGRLAEGRDAFQTVLRMRRQQREWRSAAAIAVNLSEIELILGNIRDALQHADESVTDATHSKSNTQWVASVSMYADVLHQAGQRNKAHEKFQRAEVTLNKGRREFVALRSLPGFRYCELLLSDVERRAWRRCVNYASPTSEDRNTLFTIVDSVKRRALNTLNIGEQQGWKLDVALAHLMIGRAILYRSMLSPSQADTEIQVRLTLAIDAFREARTLHELPRGLLTRAWHRTLTDDISGALSDLAEAQQIAERGPMPLYLADIHLTRARLGMINGQKPMTKDRRESVEFDLREARRLIEKHKYGRRKEELEDAEAMLAEESGRIMGGRMMEDRE